MRRFARCLLLLFGVALFSWAEASPPTLQQDPDASSLYDFAKRDAQYRALASIPDAVVKYGKYGRLRQLDGRTGIGVAGAAKLKPGDSAEPILRRLKPILLASGSESLIVRHAGRDPLGAGNFLFTDQLIGGIPVLDGGVNIILDSRGEVSKVISFFVPEGTENRSPKLSLKDAQARLRQLLAQGSDGTAADAAGIDVAAEGSLAFWTDGGDRATPQLLWMIDVSHSRDGEFGIVRYGVDAATGNVSYSQKRGFELSRTVYTHNYRMDSNTPVATNRLWLEGSPNSADTQAFSIYNRIVQPIQAWAGTPLAYDTLSLVAHWGTPGSNTANNATFIYGTDNNRYLFFGDDRASDDDAIAHEYGHGLFFGYVPMPTGWKPYHDWYAGNEFYADFSAVLTDIHRYGINSGTWAITDLRDWQHPQSRSVFHMDWYPNRYFANPLIGISYANSTIYGYAIYLMVNGGTHRRAGQIGISGAIPVINVPPSTWAQIKEVMITTIYIMTLNRDEFTGPMLKQRSMEVAGAIHGPVSNVLNTVQQGWTAVGIGHGCSSPPPAPPVVNIQSAYCKGRHDISWNPISNVKYHAMAVSNPWTWESDRAVTVVDGVNTNCTQNVPGGTLTRYRMRACNACGCSNWTNDEWMQYYMPCL
ncbi:Zn-dependent metalloprotease [Povalibacter uvarum]|uniref:Zn-dependent metalloprotease n=1 Tax=Povalibacter uvarum TaxID=732238 RepID=A0A841HTW9_9GAMM|nr:hypothetical protein [Povalibacter uvarum]MBB6096243.1 Zn-dependent metalloprotease [Povalibacter uvarum]